MPLMSFSEPSHVPLLLSGQKCQTTRAPRKTPLKVGDILHCYYKSRQRKTCGNCIGQNCKTYYAIEFGGVSQKVSTCSEHRNFFEMAKVTGILHCNNIFAMNSNKFDFNTQIFKLSEKWINGFDSQPEIFMEQWARADGFANLAEADKWFTKSTKNSLWMMQPWDVIIFESGWVK